MNDRKSHVNIGVIGHVDHSKTTLTAAIHRMLEEKHDDNKVDQESELPRKMPAFIIVSNESCNTRKPPE